MRVGASPTGVFRRPWNGAWAFVREVRQGGDEGCSRFEQDRRISVENREAGRAATPSAKLHQARHAVLSAVVRDDPEGE